MTSIWMKVNNGRNIVLHRIRRRSPQKSIFHLMLRNRRVVYEPLRKPSRFLRSKRVAAMVATTSLQWKGIAYTIIDIAVV